MGPVSDERDLPALSFKHLEAISTFLLENIRSRLLRKPPRRGTAKGGLRPTVGI